MSFRQSNRRRQVRRSRCESGDNAAELLQSPDNYDADGVDLVTGIKPEET
jgi:hypothetical protein